MSSFPIEMLKTLRFNFLKVFSYISQNLYHFCVDRLFSINYFKKALLCVIVFVFFCLQDCFKEKDKPLQNIFIGVAKCTRFQSFCKRNDYRTSQGILWYYDNFQKIYSTSDTKFNLHPILVHPKPVHQHHEYSYLLIFNVYNHIYIQLLFLLGIF